MASPAQPPHRPPLPLTLVVATTPVSLDCDSNASAAMIHSPRLGIGHAGTLPWPRIRSDMAFFARVTRQPPLASTLPASSIPATAATAASVMEAKAQPRIFNAVVMGRKTYDSLPPRVRPLPGRFNVIITRDASGTVRERVAADAVRVAGARGEARARQQWEKENGIKKGKEGGGERKEEKLCDADAPTTSKKEYGEQKGYKSTPEQIEKEEQPDPVLVSPSLESALQTLQSLKFDSTPYSPSLYPFTTLHPPSFTLAHIYIIGGAQLYSSAIALARDQPQAPHLSPLSLRILATDVRRLPDNTSPSPETEHKGTEGNDENDLRSSNYSSLRDGWRCDTFFPVTLDGIGVGDSGTDQRGTSGDGNSDGEWRAVPPATVSEWVGEPVSGEWSVEGEGAERVVTRVVGFEMCG